MTDVQQRSTRGSNPDRVRQHNLSTVLGLVHRSQGVSRSQLTLATGLNRSTIAALVGELTDAGLVRESEPAASNRVGRPSPVVAAAPGVVAFAVNPEIDAVTVGVVGLDGTVQRRIRRETDSVPTAREAADLAASSIRDVLRELPSVQRAVGIGVAVPGLVRRGDGLVRLAPHLGWVDEPFVELLREATGLPTTADNDASLGALAESLFGAGRGVGTLVFLNGGASGVGGGAIVDGRPLQGFEGYAGELGHTLVNSNGVTCHCGAVGCLETEVGQAELLHALGRARGDDDDLDALLAASTDPEVLAEVERQAGYLAIALRNVINLFNPETIVLGGFLGALFGVAGPRIESLATRGALRGPRETVRLRRAELGSGRLMIGAAELAFAALLADPAALARS
ncbi:sugar kinase [Frondihabitans sucicola]|uniref:Sugar kinase n=1 Tax=Frondihabitans sucicola TaxID=1268041 RepID=A0ABM8GIY0_9MICO|nr:ROK family protein [Frondihabitans sucicola]BDZ48124.1 sugar kinase [Frondihabitans sucicola]